MSSSFAACATFSHSRPRRALSYGCKFYRTALLRLLKASRSPRQFLVVFGKIYLKVPRHDCLYLVLGFVVPPPDSRWIFAQRAANVPSLPSG
jgi:hypothetical protein